MYNIPSFHLYCLAIDCNRHAWKWHSDVCPVTLHHHLIVSHLANNEPHNLEFLHILLGVVILMFVLLFITVHQVLAMDPS